MMTLLFFCAILILTAYVGSVIANLLYTNWYKSESFDHSLVVGFPLGQLLLIKTLTILGFFESIDINTIAATLTSLFLAVLILDWRANWRGFSRYVEIIGHGFNIKRIRPVWLTSILGLILGLAFVADINPPRHADMLRYHLEYSNYILNSGTLPFVPHNQLALATDAELLFASIIAGFGVGYVKLLIYANLVFCIYVAYIYFGMVNNATKKYAIGFFVASPILFMASTIVKPDVIQLFYFIVSLILINRLYQEFNGVNLVLAAIFLGEVIALKWTGVIPVLSLVLYLVFLYGIKAENRKTLLYLIMVIGIAVIVVPMYWYLRNYLATGNPIWPILSHLFAVDDASLLYEISTHASSRSGEIANYGFFGYLLYTFLIYKPSLFGGIGVSYYLSLPLSVYKNTDQKAGYYFVFIAIYIGIWYLAQASFRHLIWLLPFIAIMSSYGYIRTKAWRQGILRHASKLIVLLVLFQIAFVVAYSTLFVKHTIGVVDNNAYYATTPNYHAFKMAEQDIDNSLKKVLVIVPGSEIYYFNQPHIDGNSRFSAIIDYKKIDSVKNLLNRLKALDVDYILFDDELIRAEIYDKLRVITDQSSTVIANYDSKIIKNRLLDKSIIKHLTLIRLD